MSKQKYIKETLTLPAEMPLFNYNINFDGLRHLMEGVNVKTNNNEQEIKKVIEILGTKLPMSNFQKSEKKLGSCFMFGGQSQKYIDSSEQGIKKLQKVELKDMPEIDQFCWKMNKMAQMMEYLMIKTEEHSLKIANDDKKNEKSINQSFRRLDDKVTAHIDSFTKTINTYFGQSNQKVSELASNLNMLKLNTQTKFIDIQNQLQRKVSENLMKSILEGSEQKVRQALTNELKTDQVQRLTTLNELKNAIKESEKDTDLKNKGMMIKMQELAEKVKKALLTNQFQIQKHKIYQKLSQLRNKTDELFRKNGEFVDFRKNYLANNEKIKQEIIGINQEIKKMGDKESSFKKMENIGDILSSLNPHLICEIGEEVKLHEKQIGKLEKQLLTLQNELKTHKANEKVVPEVNAGQNSDLIQKIIKQFMSNMDFQGRVKRAEKDVHDLKKRNDNFTQMEKKIYMLSKQIDIGAIHKELKKKCDEQNTRRDVKILDGKIQQLFDFYKQVRRDLEEKKRVISKDNMDNASLTTKKLISANCLSCTPGTPPARKHYSRNRLQMSVDYGLESQKNTIYSRIGK